jgi:hypothetical protein
VLSTTTRTRGRTRRRSSAPAAARAGVDAGHLGGSGKRIRIEDFRIDNVRERIRACGDLRAVATARAFPAEAAVSPTPTGSAFPSQNLHI